MLLSLICCAIFVSAASQSYPTGDNRTAVGCSSHCGSLDDDLSCWNRTLHFFEQIVVSQLRYYIAVQTNIYRWNKQHVTDYEANFTAWKIEAKRALVSHLKKNDILNEQTISFLAENAIDSIKAEKESTVRPPIVQCPLPCEYRSHLWRYLFVASCILNFLLALAVAPFIIKMIRSDRDEPLLKYVFAV